MATRLDLRPWDRVVFGYVVGPLVGLIALASYMLAPTFYRLPGESVAAFVLVLLVGESLCLAAELVSSRRSCSPSGATTGVG